jgi:hypothetical protein
MKRIQNYSNGQRITPKSMLRLIFVGLVGSSLCLAGKAGTGSTATFRDAQSDCIRSDAGGSYFDGTLGVDTGVIDKSLVLDTNVFHRSALRTVLFDWGLPVNSSGPNALTPAPPLGARTNQLDALFSVSLPSSLEMGKPYVTLMTIAFSPDGSTKKYLLRVSSVVLIWKDSRTFTVSGTAATVGSLESSERHGKSIPTQLGSFYLPFELAFSLP